MPSASEMIATSVTNGALKSVRNASFRLGIGLPCRVHSIDENSRTKVYRCPTIHWSMLHVVRIDLLALQVLVEPSDDVLEALDAVPRLAGSRQLVGLVGESHHHDRALQILQRAEHLLASVWRRRPHIRFAEDEHQRR